MCGLSGTWFAPTTDRTANALRSANPESLINALRSRTHYTQATSSHTPTPRAQTIDPQLERARLRPMPTGATKRTPQMGNGRLDTNSHTHTLGRRKPALCAHTQVSGWWMHTRVCVRVCVNWVTSARACVRVIWCGVYQRRSVRDATEGISRNPRDYTDSVRSAVCADADARSGSTRPKYNIVVAVVVVEVARIVVVVTTTATLRERPRRAPVLSRRLMVVCVCVCLKAKLPQVYALAQLCMCVWLCAMLSSINTNSSRGARDT